MTTVTEATADYPGLQHLLFWVEQREAIRKRREAGQPRPWTDDPILRDWSFCNVERERDRTTVWIRENWREPHRDDPLVWFAMAVARFVNLPDALATLGYPIPWDREHFIAVMQRRKAAGEQLQGGGYIIPAGPEGASTAEHVAGILDELWQARAELQPRAGMTLDQWHQLLKRHRGLGNGFLAGQIVADAKFTGLLASAPDWKDFACPGPGSRKGLNLVLGRPENADWTDDEWLTQFHRLRHAVTPQLDGLGLRDLSASDFQNVLCETSKFILAKAGKRPKRRFEPYEERKPKRRRAERTTRAEPASPSPAPPPSPSPSLASPNPFANLDAMRLSQDFDAGTRVKKLLTTVPVRRPGTQDFFRVHPDPAYQMPAAAIIELKDEREVYFVCPEIVPEVVGEYRAAAVVTVINRQGVLSLWCLKLPDPGGRRDDWSRSALEAADVAMKRWVRLRPNMNLGAYEIHEAQDKIPDPEWPSVPFPEILHIAFRDRLIDSVDHPVLKRLRGAS